MIDLHFDDGNRKTVVLPILWPDAQLQTIQRTVESLQVSWPWDDFCYTHCGNGSDSDRPLETWDVRSLLGSLHRPEQNLNLIKSITVYITSEDWDMMQTADGNRMLL